MNYSFIWCVCVRARVRACVCEFVNKWTGKLLHTLYICTGRLFDRFSSTWKLTNFNAWPSVFNVCSRTGWMGTRKKYWTNTYDLQSYCAQTNPLTVVKTHNKNQLKKSTKNQIETHKNDDRTQRHRPAGWTVGLLAWGIRSKNIYLYINYPLLTITFNARHFVHTFSLSLSTRWYSPILFVLFYAWYVYFGLGWSVGRLVVWLAK